LNGHDKLYLGFHGRIIDSPGIRMYQSPVAAIAELIANAWDADAESVRINPASDLSGNSEIVIEDSGHGMTFQECQDTYPDIGRNRRTGANGEESRQGKPVPGRKGTCPPVCLDSLPLSVEYAPVNKPAGFLLHPQAYMKGRDQ